MGSIHQIAFMYGSVSKYYICYNILYIKDIRNYVVLGLQKFNSGTPIAECLVTVGGLIILRPLLLTSKGYKVIGNNTAVNYVYLYSPEGV